MGMNDAVQDVSLSAALPLIYSGQMYTDETVQNFNLTTTAAADSDLFELCRRHYSSAKHQQNSIHVQHRQKKSSSNYNKCDPTQFIQC